MDEIAGISILVGVLMQGIPLYIARMTTVRTLLDLGLEHHHAGRLSEAAACYGDALARDDTNAETHHLLGILAFHKGEIDNAINHFSTANLADPRNPKYLGNLGSALIALNRYGDAEEILEQATTLDPESALWMTNFALAVLERPDPEQALELVMKALALDENLSDAHAAHGAVLIVLERYEDSLPVLEQAIALGTDEAEARSNIGYALMRLLRSKQAIEQLNISLTLRPENAEAQLALGLALRFDGRFEQGLDVLDNLIRNHPDHGPAKYARSRIALVLGRFDEAWSYYRERNPGPIDITRYAREDISNTLRKRTICVEGDQGLGDEIFFLRYLRTVRDQGCTISYRTHKRLMPIFERAGIADKIINRNTDFSPDDEVFLCGDLPHLLGRLRSGEQNVVPPTIRLTPLKANRDKSAAILKSFGPPPYIGVAWRAGLWTKIRKARKDIPIEAFADAMRDVPGSLVAIQRQPEAGEIDAFQSVLGRPMLDCCHLNDDLEDALALMDLLDDYVGVSSTNVHFREALGHTSRVLVPWPAEFRWMARGAESPWFPGTRIYRQAIDGNWATAFDELSSDLGNSATEISRS
jgi:tetratricopeptide (TPR) repeat protein